MSKNRLLDLVMMPREKSLLYVYPEHLKEDVRQAPRAPGVYVFYGEDERLPLYIGKSVNLRSRLNAHLCNTSEARLLHQTRRIAFECTAGEVGALLLEAHLIKTRQPLFNRRLRRLGTLHSLVLRQERLDIRSAAKIDYGVEEDVFGLFKNRHAAIAYIRELADEHRLCLQHLGVEKASGRRGCFRASIGKCSGVCVGRELPSEHTARLVNALASYRIASWPFPGPVALRERYDTLEQVHIVDHWHYLGSFDSLAQACQAAWQVVDTFDADVYRILAGPILKGEDEVIRLVREGEKVSVVPG